ncbi:methyltransferase domain-containing protein [Streptomyces sp. 3MP-14]|uniref:Methyltransferase domain-containing protein n=1 Tax=Streptomyces mimosae TaxID=2586635 RepID=A0A5N6AEE7_9ACTN|nr:MULTISPECIES: class I SAM-dependent methyltransferase [Streptomyces]KAB8166346.1 methyltransferase domain-containing protein [Streptomyces mimosae]KAB8174139.1 methyltransferase domain-containing protein [Streptomyces sp. 3MP-14]
MFSPQGPTARELAVQALSSVERGYDLLAPKFDHTPFRTPDVVLDATARELAALGPFEAGLDLCCGTGAGLGVLRAAGARRVVGVDRSAGMLAVAAEADERGKANGADGPGAADGADRRGGAELVRADVRALPFRSAFDLAVSFGAFGHFLAGDRRALFAAAREALRPGGLLAFPVAAPPRVGSRGYWLTWGFDAAMRVRNALWRPPFVMYYRTFPLSVARAELAEAGFAVGTVPLPLPELGERPDGTPRCRLVLARRP